MRTRFLEARHSDAEPAIPRRAPPRLGHDTVDELAQHGLRMLGMTPRDAYDVSHRPASIHAARRPARVARTANHAAPGFQSAPAGAEGRVPVALNGAPGVNGRERQQLGGDGRQQHQRRSGVGTDRAEGAQECGVSPRVVVVLGHPAGVLDLAGSSTSPAAVVAPAAGQAGVGGQARCCPGFVTGLEPSG